MAFVRGKVDAVASALEQTLRDDGRTLVSAPPPRRPPHGDPMQYGDGESAPLWGIAVIPGTDGWVIVKTAPFSLLCERTADEHVPRIAKLAKLLRTEAFQLNVYDGTAIVLLEADAHGHARASGFAYPDPKRWHGFTMVDGAPAFGLLEGVPKKARDGVSLLSSVDALEAVCTALAGENVCAADNVLNVDVLIPHAPLVIHGARVLYFARAGRAAAARGPLAIRIAESTSADPHSEPEPRRLDLRIDAGEVWITGNAIVAPDPERGGVFLEAIARWVGVHAPPEAQKHVLLEPLFCSIVADGDSMLLRLGEREQVSLRLRRVAGFSEHATLEETDPALRERLVHLLAPALRDGVGGQRQGRPLVERWERLTDEQVHVVDGAGFVGETLIAGAWRDNRGVMLASDEPGQAARDVAAFSGLVTTLVPAPRGRVAAACVVTRSTSTSPARGYGGDDEASLVLVDLVAGAQRTLIDGVDPSTAITWSPEGDALAVRLARDDARGPTVVLEIAPGRTKPRFTSARGAEALAWDLDGLLLAVRDFKTFGPPAFFRWSGGRTAEACEATLASPDGDYRVAMSSEGLLIKDGSGATRTLALPSQKVSVLAFHQGLTWPSASSLILHGADPCVVSLKDGSTTLLAPPANELSPAAVSASGERFAAFHHEGRLVWGRVTRS